MLAQVGIAHAATEAVAAGLRIEAEQIVAIKTALVRPQLADDSRRIEGHRRLLLPLKAWSSAPGHRKRCRLATSRRRRPKRARSRARPSRHLCNRHWPSDQEGRKIAPATASRQSHDDRAAQSWHGDAPRIAAR